MITAVDGRVYCDCGSPATTVRTLETSRERYPEQLCAKCAAIEDGYRQQLDGNEIHKRGIARRKQGNQ